MSVKLAFNRIEQFSDGNGNPYSGAKLFTYVGGSVNTKQTTYTESTGSIANTNPIILDAFGQLPQPIWLTTGVTYKFVLAPSTDTDPPTSPIWTLDGITGVNDSTTTVNEWIAGPVPTFVSATSFTLVGDQTSTFAKSRRIKATVTAGTVYGTIVNTAFGALTTVTVALDSGNLDSGLSAVSYGVIAPVNPSIDADMVNRKGTAVASAATTDIWSIAGDYVHVTGNTGPITSFGTAPYAGARREVIFDSTPTITHNATTLQLPGGLNLVAAAGDRMIVRADTTANMIVMNFIRATGVPVIGVQSANTVLAGPTSGAAASPTFRALVGAESSMVLLGSKTLSASASATFVHTGGSGDVIFDWTAYDEIEFHFVQVVPATNAVGLQAQISEDSGSTYKSGALSYSSYLRILNNTVNGLNASASSLFNLSGDLSTYSVSNGTDYGINGTFTINKPSSAIKKTIRQYLTQNPAQAVGMHTIDGSHIYSGDAGAWTGIKFFFSSGNMASGTIYAYGIRKV